MKKRWSIVFIAAAVSVSILGGFEDPAVLKECKNALAKFEKDIQSVQALLDPLTKEIDKRESRLAHLNRVFDEVGKPFDKAQEELKKIIKDYAERKRRSVELVGDLARKLDRSDPVLAELGSKAEAKEKEIKNLIRVADKKVQDDLKTLELPPLDLKALRIELKANNKSQAADLKTQRNHRQKIADLNDDLIRKRKECENIEKQFQKLGGLNTGPSEGVVTFIGGIQIPTPKSGMDIPLVEEIEPVWPNYWEYFPLMQISPKDSRTKVYYDTLRKDFGDALLGDEKTGQTPALQSMFEGSATEFGKLLQTSEDAGWKGTPIQHYQGPYLVRVVCAGQTRYRFHYTGPEVKTTFGGIQLFGLAAGRHPVAVTIATGNAQRYEAQFEVFVHFEPQKGTITEMGKDGIVREGKTIIVDLPYLKKQFQEMWDLHMQGRSQTQGKPGLRREVLKGGVGLVQNYTDWMKKKPGCTPTDIGHVLAKGAGAVSLLLTEFGADKADYVAWRELGTMTRLCKQAGTKEAYDALAPLVLQAAGSAPANRLSTIATAYIHLGDLALMLGDFDRAVKHLNTAWDYKQRADAKFDRNKEQIGLPRVDQLKIMLTIMGN